MPQYGLSDMDETIDEGIEPAHPLGFETPKTNWISDTEGSSLLFSPGRSTYTLDFSDSSDDDDDDRGLFVARRTKQSFPPLSSYISSKTVSTKTLLQYQEPRQDYDDDDESSYGESELLQQISQQLNLNSINMLSKTTPSINFTDWAEEDRKIQQKLQLERQRLDEQFNNRSTGLQQYVQEVERDAALILKDRQDKEEALRREQEAVEAKAQRDAKEKEEKELRQREAAQAQREMEAAAKKKEEEAKAEEEKAKEEAAKPPEYVQKAKKLVAQLVVLRKSVEPFDKNAVVKKRRFQMKKITGGKISTLSADAGKIQAVATDVSQAVSAAREEDTRIKEQLKQKEPGVTPDMAVGKRYMLDLLASNAMKRIQAEGFNGPRGDGFPLAILLAIVSLENKELVPILAAHIYTVCPIAIPVFPKPGSNASEDDLMSSLGMQKGKDGEFESWDRFASRTENIVSMVANIQASSPSTHNLLGGHQGAVNWLSRFLDLLPPPPTSPLPLLTAPVLYAFLSGAGNMLATKHTEFFKKNLDIIINDVAKRLDEGAIGKPSAIRLSKLLEKGFDGFKNNLPEKAVPELYFGEAGVGTTSSSLPTSTASTSSQNQSGFGNAFSKQTNSNNASTFGKPNPSQSTNPFGGGVAGGNNTSVSQSTNPFGGSTSTSTAFGGSNSNTSNNNTFGNSSFGQSNANSIPSSNSQFGSMQTNSNPFGGGNTASSQSTFGGPSSSNTFGGPANQSVGFGSNVTNNTSPFGAPANSSSNNPFGGNQAAPSPSPFGTFSSNPSPFGNTSSNPGAFGNNQSSFGGGNQGQAFGGQQKNNSFSGATKKKAPCKFFAKGNCRFGQNCKFSHEGGGGSGFPGGGSSAFGSGSGNKPGSNPFGGGGSSGFGSGGASFGSNNAGFGGGSNPFGGGSFQSNKRSPFG